jgi:hypothetical protein
VITRRFQRLIILIDYDRADGNENESVNYSKLQKSLLLKSRSGTRLSATLLEKA